MYSCDKSSDSAINRKLKKMILFLRANMDAKIKNNPAVRIVNVINNSLLTLSINLEYIIDPIITNTAFTIKRIGKSDIPIRFTNPATSIVQPIMKPTLNKNDTNHTTRILDHSCSPIFNNDDTRLLFLTTGCILFLFYNKILYHNQSNKERATNLLMR